ncbi:MAG: glutamate-semialdehyde -aminomutase [Pseudonocardiales bacterium]|jgi:glutamate-1-semialdehyde 2,1-aminomutase|nr:glutamate-semialdehyde -aminomutase [Pseudonocardiales bacterium]
MNPARLALLLTQERQRFADDHPRSRAAFDDARRSLFGGVPMTWMNKAAGGFPLYVDTARGATVRDIDGIDYVDFALGDTGAMAGHSPEATVAAIRRRVEDLGGLTTMMPTEEAAWVGAELGRRFGVPLWSFSLSATDANRWALRLARAATGRPKILVNSYCYHGTVDEVLVKVDEAGRPVEREGNVGAPVDPTTTTRVVEYNDLAALERELAHGDVACVIMEPALTNVGIVLPEPGYLDGVRALTRAAGTLLINDETHTISAGPGGATRAWGLDPDMVTIGKTIGGGVPSGGFGMTAELAARIEAMPGLDLIDWGGVGGTLAGNPLSVAAMRATLGEVLTDDVWVRTTELADRFGDAVQAVVDEHGLPWSVSRLGARVEYRFCNPAPRTGGESAAAADDELDDYLHVYLANRGVLMTPFHNMALMSPATSEADVDRHTEVFGAAVRELLSA